MLYDGEKVADDIIAGNYDFDLRISVKYLFKNYPITIKGVAKCTGINRTLLNHYAKSDKTMSERQAFRITKTINDIGDDLRRLHL